jgi:hypothetical protein
VGVVVGVVVVVADVSCWVNAAPCEYHSSAGGTIDNNRNKGPRFEKVNIAASAMVFVYGLG